jgi:hypothetical protein
MGNVHPSEALATSSEDEPDLFALPPGVATSLLLSAFGLVLNFFPFFPRMLKGCRPGHGLVVISPKGNKVTEPRGLLARQGTDPRPVAHPEKTLAP